MRVLHGGIGSAGGGEISEPEGSPVVGFEQRKDAAHEDLFGLASVEKDSPQLLGLKVDEGSHQINGFNFPDLGVEASPFPFG
jgi:hypothetical protein